ncbi:BTAD domain-containing putative transcriptional regulator [Streptomyces sp. NPDC059224]|uniref:AfsR/SARP family transcriptional regulator n=1 Tax=Streptomyces sp. NPDC059224 TaxID=3346775 RepID=UPI0036C67D6C
MRRYELRFGLLGAPVLYLPGGEVRPIGSPKVRALLATLLLEAGRIVSVGSVKDALWGGAPPVSAQASLHNHVTRLRRLLDDPERLRAVPPGYLLRVDGGELDVEVFDTRVAQARAAHGRREWATVLSVCADGLGLWRGSPLCGLPAGFGGYAFVQRLEEARLLLLEWRYDAELALGGPRLGGVVPELTALVAEYPLREAYHRQLMLALHRTGRQAEALAVHRDLRNRLIEELGVEPGTAVREAHVRVLRGSDGAGEGAPYQGASDGSPPSAQAGGGGRTGSGVSVTEASGDRRSADDGGDADAGAGCPPDDEEERPAGPGSARVGPAPPCPAQLPAAPAYFTGRDVVREELRRALVPAAAPAVAVVSGMAGVGKSALALHVAHDLRERFPDGQLYVNLHGATPGVPPLAPAQALAALLRDLGADPRHIPDHPDAAAALLRSLLAPTRTLLLFDDAANAAQVRPLLPGGPGCAVIVTSRSPLTALDGARGFPLGPLTGEDSAALLRTVSGRAEIDAGHPLVGLTGRLPLALRVVAARLAARRALTPEVLAGQLAATEGRLHHLEYDDLSVRRSLAVAHDALAASARAPDRDAALALRHVGALDLPTYGALLVARLTGLDAPRAEAALDRLVEVALLEETAYGRYTPHDLVRDFARELAEGTDRTEAALTVLRWFAAVAELSLVAILEPGLEQSDRRRPTVAQPAEHRPYTAALAPFECAETAFAWGDLELENIVALVERYAETADPRISAYLSTLVRLLFPYVLRSGRVAEMEVLGTAALAAARRLGDEPAEAYALGDLAGLHFLTGRQREALALTDQALAIWRRLGVVSWIRRSLNNRGLLLEGLGRYEESGEALRQSLEYSRQLNDPYGEAVTHSHLGNLYEHTDPRAAIEQHRRSLAIGDAIGAVIVQHSARCNIGYAHLTLGEPAAAATHFEDSLRVLGQHGDWHGESQTRLGLVRALRGTGDTDRAQRECAELLHRADARADRYSGGLARHQLGLLLREQGRTSEAHDAWRAALAALDGTDAPDVLVELRELLSAGD